MNKQEIDNLKVGDIIYDSWGYDMTINDYCEILEIKGKRLKCIRVKADVKQDDGRGNGNSKATRERFGKEFILQIRSYKPTKYNPEEYWYIVGSYPYCFNDDTAKKRGTFRPIEEGKTQYYNTWD